MNPVLKHSLKSDFFNNLVYRFIRIYSSTFRLRIENEDKWLSHLNGGGRVLLCAWHQQFFSAIRYFRKFQEYKPSLMISKSSDGDLIAGVAGRTGWRPARGSSSAGGKTAMNQMISYLKETGLAAHIVDGPRGPMGKVKAGAIRIALEAEAAIVPFYITADRAWHFNSWDKFFLPRPFSKVTLTYGEMIKLHENPTQMDFESMRQLLESTMKPWLLDPLS
jgi:lysophospholipid acyltransferase (LPLAT)-like uncharacterized protein